MSQRPSGRASTCHTVIESRSAVNQHQLCGTPSLPSQPNANDMNLLQFESSLNTCFCVARSHSFTNATRDIDCGHSVRPSVRLSVRRCHSGIHFVSNRLNISSTIFIIGYLPSFYTVSHKKWTPKQITIIQ